MDTKDNLFTFNCIPTIFSLNAGSEGQDGEGQANSAAMKRQLSTAGVPSSKLAEEAVDQLQENEKLVAGESQ